MNETSRSTTPPATDKPRRKWPRVLLAVSLTLNLLVLGLVLGAKASGHHGRDFDPRGPERGAIAELGFAPLAGAFDLKDRRAIGKGFKERAGSFRDNREHLKDEFDAMLKTLRAEPFDQAALLALMEAQSNRIRGHGDTLRALVIERISLMSAKERAEFADRIERKVKHGRRSDGHDTGRDMGRDSDREGN